MSRFLWLIFLSSDAPRNIRVHLRKSVIMRKSRYLDLSFETCAKRLIGLFSFSLDEKTNIYQTICHPISNIHEAEDNPGHPHHNESTSPKAEYHSLSCIIISTIRSAYNVIHNTLYVSQYMKMSDRHPKLYLFMWQSFPEYGNIFETAHSEISFSSVTDISRHDNSYSSDIQMQTKHCEIAKYRKL